MSLRSQLLAGLRTVNDLRGEVTLYRRGALEAPVRLLYSERLEQAATSEGRVVETRVATVRIIASDLDWLGHPDHGSQPCDGDEICRDIQGRRQVLRILPGDDGHVWRWDSSYQLQYLCRVTEVTEGPR